MAARAGILDVDRWLQTITPETFDKWIAFYRLEPDPDERLREIVKTGFIMLARSWGAEDVKPDDLDRWAEQKTDLVTPREAAELMADKMALVGIKCQQ
jgi:hypothetical protein